MNREWKEWRWRNEWSKAGYLSSKGLCASGNQNGPIPEPWEESELVHLTGSHGWQPRRWEPPNVLILETSSFLPDTICHPSTELVAPRHCEAGHDSRVRELSAWLSSLFPNPCHRPWGPAASPDAMFLSRCFSCLVSNRAAVRSLHYLSAR